MSAPGCPFPPRSFAFNTLTPQQPWVTAPVTAHRPFRPELTHSTCVDARKHVNALFFASDGRRCLIPLTFPHGYRPVSLQQPAGGDVPPLKPMRSTARPRDRHKADSGQKRRYQRWENHCSGPPAQSHRRASRARFGQHKNANPRMPGIALRGPSRLVGIEASNQQAYTTTHRIRRASASSFLSIPALLRTDQTSTHIQMPACAKKPALRANCRSIPNGLCSG